ncbi:MAG TPA: hypothetical protein VI172_16035 [Candidatus Dormibacteraeota bacterium]|jgi:hypothetical protein
MAFRNRPRASTVESGRYFPSTLEPLPTLSKGQCCDLKLEDEHHRVWLCRSAGGVTVETLRSGRWQVTSGSCDSDSAEVK